jgi:hypothetical protein
MRLFTWLRPLASRFAQPRRVRPYRRAAGVRLSLEALEDRALPSTFSVTNLADSGPGSLRAAITAANANPGADLIRFAGGLTGTISLTSASGELSVTDDLTIDGPNANQLTVSGGNATRVFHVSGTATHLAIDGLTISNGLASLPGGNALGGGLLNDAASVSLAHVVFASNQAVGAGAGGGAVANIGGHLTADHTDFLGNTSHAADDNFAMGAVLNDNSATTDIAYGTFSGNQAIGGNSNGGAIGVAGGSQVTLGQCSFDGNLSLGGQSGGGFGGAIVAEGLAFFNFAAPTMDISHCSFSGNQALVRAATGGNDGGQGNGGAIAMQDGTMATVSYSSFDGNQARGGDGSAGGGAGGASEAGAIGNAGATLIISHSQFMNNQARGGNGGQGAVGGDGGNGGFGIGGAVTSTFLVNGPIVAPTTQISDCQFLNNRAIGGDGGAGGVGGNGGSGFRGDGAGIINLLGTMTVSDSTIKQNAATGGRGGAAGSGGVGGDGGLGRAGGFANERGGTATLTRVSIVNNQATGGAAAPGGNGGNALGGGVYNGRLVGTGPSPTQAATLELTDCTVSANQAIGGAGGLGGKGGFASGGGIYNGNTGGTGTPQPGTAILDLDGTNVTANQVVGGAAGAGGATGTGVGGGLYNQAGAAAEVDAFTVIKGNKASTSDDDVFGIVTSI